MSDEFQDVNGTATDNASYEPEQGVQDSSDASLEQAETASDSEPEQSESEHRRHGNGFQKRIQKLVADRNYWKQQAMARGTQSVDSENEPSDVDQQGHRADGVQQDEYEQYYQTRRAEEKSQELQTAHEGRIEKTRQSRTDYDQVVKSLLDEFGDVQFHDDVRDTIREMDNAGEVWYQLGKDHNRMAEILSLPPARQAAALSRLSVELKHTSRELPISQAPAPMQPERRPSSGARSDSPRDDMPIDKWVQARERQLSRK